MGCISPEASQAATPWQRFEHEAPNELWQIYFKGHFSTCRQRCHALTVLDDHSRFNVVLQALRNERRCSVQPVLLRASSVTGCPARQCRQWMPWVSPSQPCGMTGLGRVADAAGSASQLQQAAASADQRQGRALPPHHEGRGAGPASSSSICTMRTSTSPSSDKSTTSNTLTKPCICRHRRASTTPVLVPCPKSLPPIEYALAVPRAKGSEKQLYLLAWSPDPTEQSPGRSARVLPPTD